MAKAKVKPMRHNVVVGPDYTKAKLEMLIIDTNERGDVLAGINILMHNQVIIDDKLNKLGAKKAKVTKKKK